MAQKLGFKLRFKVLKYDTANLTFRGPRVVIYSYNKSQQDTQFLIFI